MPKMLSLKKVGGTGKNQKPITTFFKHLNEIPSQCPNSHKRKTTLTSENRLSEKECFLNNHNSTVESLEKPSKKLRTACEDPSFSYAHKEKVLKTEKQNRFKSSLLNTCDFDNIPENKTSRTPLSPVENGKYITKHSLADDDKSKVVINDVSETNLSSQEILEKELVTVAILQDINKARSQKANTFSITENTAATIKTDAHSNGMSPTNITKTTLDQNEPSAKVALEFNNVKDLFDDDWDCADIDEKCNEDLDLSILQRCEVIRVMQHSRKLEIRLKNSKEEQSTCFIQGICLHLDAMHHTPLSPGDIVSIYALRDSSDQFSVTNTDGLLVLRPDHLLSTTSVVAGVFCQRKAILQERFKGIDSANNAMTIGILIHELVQKALTNKIKDVKQLRSEANSIIKESTHMLYDAGVSVEETQTTMEMYLLPLAEFMQTYVSEPSLKLETKAQKGKWSGEINDILDIEENVCCPQLGLKGKIDATLQVTIHDRKGSKQITMPLELKSGRASGSAEHRGQLVLYGMMLSVQRNHPPITDDQRGLLLYLKERVDLREVSCGHNEKRDLIMLRNQLVQYLANGPNSVDPEKLTDIEEASHLLHQRLPDPVHHETACAKCPYLTLCSLHLWHTEDVAVSESHPLAKLQDQALGHLSLEHIKYFLHWTALLKMEERIQMKLSPLHALWTEELEKRVNRGACASNLKLKTVYVSGDRFLHKFEKSDNPQDFDHSDKNAKGLQEGEFSVVSVMNRPWIAAGVLMVVKGNEIHILLERDLSRRFSKETIFYIDTYESYATTVQNLTNLGALMEDSDRAFRLRRLIIDKQQPEFDTKLNREVGRLGTKLMRSLNIQQQRAVLKALTAKHYALLQGLPGTGKTQTISVLIQMLVALKKRVLVTAHTHSAVDTVLARLPSSVRVMRLGSSARVSASILPRCEQTLVSGCDTPEKLQQLYDSMEVVGVTCLGSSHAMLARTTFDICIVDEATQVLQCTVLRPLLAARRFVLVGDPEQLPPVVRSRAARRLGMESSLFHRLNDTEATSTLQLQYRMNAPLNKLANEVSYGGRLKCANENVRDATVHIDMKIITQLYSIDHPWLVRSCSHEFCDAALFIDTAAIVNKTNGNRSCANVDEAYLVLMIIEALGEGGVELTDIGIIAPYREQVALLRRAVSQLKNIGPPVEVSTVDQFQGRDKSVIIFSCTRSGDGQDDVKEGEVLNDQRRLAVSLTRAKHKLLVIGDSRALRKYAPLQTMIRACTALQLSNEVHKDIAKRYESYV